MTNTDYSSPAYSSTTALHTAASVQPVHHHESLLAKIRDKIHAFFHKIKTGVESFSHKIASGLAHLGSDLFHGHVIRFVKDLGKDLTNIVSDVATHVASGANALLEHSPMLKKALDILLSFLKNSRQRCSVGGQRFDACC